MPRSRWKPVNVDMSVIKKIRPIAAQGGPLFQKGPIRTYQRASMILPDYIGYRFEIHNGKDFIPLTVRDEHVGLLFGMFSMTRKRPQFPAPKNGKAGKK